jgi:tetratricopeptide (TPR) repeat protein
MKRIVWGAAAVTILMGQQRFDFKVREDFFVGFAGNRVALDRGMKNCEEALASDPTNADALVWHGAGLFFLSGQSFQKGDLDKGMALYSRGLKEMDDAVSLAPDKVSVLIPRGAGLLAATRAMPPGDASRKLLAQGLADFEKVYEIQEPYFDKLSAHARGELLIGLAEGYLRAGDEPKAREYFEKLAAMGAASGHDAEVKLWRDTGKLDPKRVACTGCHVKS